jgi:superfamily I DNA and/or RNA helicase
MEVKEIKKFGFYELLQPMQELPNSFISYVKSADNTPYFIKIPKGFKTSGGAGRMFSNTLQKLKNIKNPYLAQIINYGRQDDHLYIIMDDCSGLKNISDISTEDDFSIFRILTIWYKCAQALQLLAGQNIYHRDLHPANILLKETEDGELDPIIIDIGWAELEQTISENSNELTIARAFAAPELITNNESVNRKHSDIYSLAQIVIYNLIGHQKFNESRNTTSRLKLLEEKCQQESKKPELIESLLTILRSCLEEVPLKRIGDYIVLQAEIKKCLDVMAGMGKGTVLLNCDNIEGSDETNGFIKEAQESGIFFEVSLHKNNFNLATQSYILMDVEAIYQANDSEIEIDLDNLGDASLLFSNEEIIHIDEANDGLEKIFNRIKRFGNYFENVKIQFIDNDTSILPEDIIDVHTLFSRMLTETKAAGVYSRLSENQEEEFKKWEIFIDAQINYLRKYSFKINYTNVRYNEKEAEAIFTLKEANKNIVNSFINKTIESARKSTAIGLFIQGQFKNAKNKESSVGYAYRYDSEKSELTLKNFIADKDSVPINGTLCEDIDRELSQYNRQKKAISDFRKANIINPELRNYLFNSSELPDAAIINFPIEVISRDKNKNPVEFNDSQLNATEKSLFRSPITLIQGPPGTGKTTVITEVIRQLVKQNPDVKILITSQTNLAVDNVLNKIDSDENIKYIRLGDEEKISHNSIKNQSYKSKLATWGSTAKKKSEANFASKYNGVELNPILENIYSKYRQSGNDWIKAKKELENVISFGKHPYASLINHLNSRGEFEKEMKKHFPKDYFEQRALKNIHERWIKTLSNIADKASITEKMMKSVNVIGATCNHIAAGMYRNYKFVFDFMIMDEAAKATLPETLVPVNMSRNIILIGDHKQLPPLVLATPEIVNEIEEKLNTHFEVSDTDFDTVYSEVPTLFESMYEESPDDYKEMLNTQYRMPVALGTLISKYVYDNDLNSISGISGKPHEYAGLNEIVLIDTGDTADRQSTKIITSYANPYNAKVIIDILNYLDKFKVTSTYSIGIITGYSAQANELERVLKKQKFNNIKLPFDFKHTSGNDLVVSTVDRFQGSEKDIIIFDVVRSDDKGDLGFLEKSNRINVAFSRAERLMICVADVKFVTGAKTRNQSKALIQKLIESLKINAQLFNSTEIKKLSEQA